MEFNVGDRVILRKMFGYTVMDGLDACEVISVDGMFVHILDGSMKRMICDYDLICAPRFFPGELVYKYGAVERVTTPKGKDYCEYIINGERYEESCFGEVYPKEQQEERPRCPYSADSDGRTIGFVEGRTGLQWL